MLPLYRCTTAPASNGKPQSTAPSSCTTLRSVAGDTDLPIDTESALGMSSKGSAAWGPGLRRRVDSIECVWSSLLVLSRTHLYISMQERMLVEQPPLQQLPARRKGKGRGEGKEKPERKACLTPSVEERERERETDLGGREKKRVSPSGLEPETSTV